MPRKPRKGYFVRGEFVAAGSELDLELKRELKGLDDTHTTTRADQKRESDALQALGESLLTLRAELFTRLALPEKLVEALAEARRITDFEGRRRQLQYVGKLMRKLEDATVAAAREALAVQHQGSAAETAALHAAERWRTALLADDDTTQRWVAEHPGTDTQQLRALVRQARRDAQPETPGAASRHGRAYRELFQLLREALGADAPAGALPQPDDADTDAGDAAAARNMPPGGRANGDAA